MTYVHVEAFAEEYRQTGRWMMDRAEWEFAQGDLIQASEKGWNAAAQFLKAIATQRGWGHESHAHLAQVANRLADDMGNPEIADLFSTAKSLRANFYGGYRSEAAVRQNLDAIQRYLDILATVPPPATVDVTEQEPNIAERAEEYRQTVLWPNTIRSSMASTSRGTAVNGTFNMVDSYTHRVSHRNSDLTYKVVCNDNFDVIPSMADKSVDLVVTSPPYFQQRTYTSLGLGNEDTVDEYLNNIMKTLTEIIRVMKPTGNIVYNMGDKINAGGLQLVPYRFAIKAIDELGLRLVNDITWVKRNPTPHQFSRRLVNSTEPFFHFALGGKYYYDRPSFQPSNKARRSKPTNRLGSGYRKIIETSGLTQEERSAAHDALDEVIEEVRKGSIHSFRMKIRGVHAPAYGGQDGGRKMHIERDGFTIIRISGESMKKDVIESPVESRKGNGHPAIFPIAIIQEVIRLLCPPGGQVLDPYMGSGSTAIAALREGRNCIGIEISQEYCDQAVARIIGESND